MIPWWAYSLLASASAASIEMFMRGQPTLLDAWARIWPLVLLLQTCLYFSYNGAPSLLGAWIVFTIATSMMRLGVAWFILAEAIKLPWALVGMTLAALAALAIKRATV
jgi:hypothetical protein